MSVGFIAGGAPPKKRDNVHMFRDESCDIGGKPTTVKAASVSVLGTSRIFVLDNVRLSIIVVVEL